jgi:hypothetical protein
LSLNYTLTSQYLEDSRGNLTESIQNLTDFDKLVAFVSSITINADYVNSMIKRLRVDSTTPDNLFYLTNTLEYQYALIDPSLYLKIVLKVTD